MKFKWVVVGAVALVAVLMLWVASAQAVTVGPRYQLPEVEAIAPGGNITSVVEATDVLGWPHRATNAERYDITMIVYFTFTPPRSLASTGCRFPTGRPSLAICRVEYGRPRHRVTFNVRVKVWEDGSYRMIPSALRRA